MRGEWKLCLVVIVVSVFGAVTLAEGSGGWQQVADLPSPFMFTGSAPLAVLDDQIYALCGTGGPYPDTSGCRDFWRYDPSVDAWTKLADIPVSTNFTGGVTLVATRDSIYAHPGGFWFYDYLWRYSPASDSWQAVTRFPWNTDIEWGTSMVWTGGEFLYVSLKRADDGFYRLHLATLQWEKLPNPPFLPLTSYPDPPFSLGTGSTLVWTGGDDLYLNRGPGYPWWSPYGPELARYSISSNTWTPLAIPPTQIASGMAWDGVDAIYARAYTSLYSYSISNNAWTQHEDFPVAGDSREFDLVMAAGNLYSAEFRFSPGFWRFSLNQPPVPHTGMILPDEWYEVGEGSSIVLDGTQSYDPEGREIEFWWDLDGDSVFEAYGAEPTFFADWFDNPQVEEKLVILRVCDDQDACSEAEALVKILDLAPDAAFTWWPDPPNEGSLVEFTDRSTSEVDEIEDWLWDLGTSDTSTEQNPSFTYPDNGDFTVTLTVTDDDGSTSTTEELVTIANVAPVVNAGPDGEVNIDIPFASSGEFFDPGTDEWVGTVDYGDGAGPQDLPLGGDKSFDLSYHYTSKGSYMVTACVRDDEGDEGCDSATVDVVNRPPVALCQDATMVADASCQATLVPASFDGGCYDPDDDALTVSLHPDLVTGLGDFPLTLTVDDGEFDDSCGATVTVMDSSAPLMGGPSANPAALWPANHKMVNVNIAVTATDACDLAPECLVTNVTSNEPETGCGSGKKKPDWMITGALSVDLRAERCGRGDGRVYTIEVSCADDTGNSSTMTTEVLVKHDQGG